MITKKYLDGRILVNGRSSILNTDNPFSLTDHITAVVFGTTSPGSVPVPLTFSNGLTLSSGNVAKLGGTLIENTAVDLDTFQLEHSFTDSNSDVVTMELGDNTDLSAIGAGSLSGYRFQIQDDADPTHFLVNYGTADVGSFIPLWGVVSQITNDKKELVINTDSISIGYELANSRTRSLLTTSSAELDSFNSSTNEQALFRADNNYSVQMQYTGGSANDYTSRFYADDSTTSITRNNISTSFDTEMTMDNTTGTSFLVNAGGPNITMSLVFDCGDGTPSVKIDNLPVYADEGAATAASLDAGTIYQTATGELRIKL